MGSGILAAVTAAQRTARSAAIALGFSVPISVALDNVLLVIVVVAWLLAGAWREKWETIRRNPVALAALALFGLLAMGTLYGDRYPGEAGRALSKYADLIYLIVFIHIFRDADARRYALYALSASLALVMLLSYLLAAGMPPIKGLFVGSAEHPTGFKSYLTHSILMAYCAFLYAELALATPTTTRRRVFFGIAALAAANVLLVTGGRTGQVVLGALVLYFGYTWRGWRGFGYAAMLGAVVVAALLVLPGTFQQRYGLSASAQPTEKARQSARERLEFYSNSLDIIAEHPIAGVGTGGFSKAYAERVPATIRNPHNEYLLIAGQLGLIGLAALLHLFWRHWRHAPQLATPLEQRLARGVLLTIAIGCLFNSLLLDHTEGLFYAWLTGMLFAGLESPLKA